MGQSFSPENVSQLKRMLKSKVGQLFTVTRYNKRNEEVASVTRERLSQVLNNKFVGLRQETGYTGLFSHHMYPLAKEYSAAEEGFIFETELSRVVFRFLE